MAYKFQIGAATLSGSVTHKQSATFQSGLDNNEQNMVNVGDIALDSISADGSQLDIRLSDNEANALEIKEGSNVYQKFVTTNGSEAIEFMKPTDFGNQASANMNIDSGDIASSVVVNKSPVVNFNSGDVQGSITLTNLASGTGALTIQADSVEQSMMANDSVGADELAANAVVNASIASNAAIDMDKLDGGSLAASLSDLAQGDLLYAGDVDDSNNIKSITFSNLEDAIFGNVSGDAAIAAGGALTISADSVEGTMLHTSAADGSTMELSSDSLSVLKVPNALTAGTGLAAAGTFDGAAARTLSVGASQTTISSILHDSLKIGRADGQDHIDFGTDDNIQFDIDDTATLNVSANGLDVQQGGIQIPAGSAIDVAGAGALSVGATVGANNLTLGAASSTIVIPGNLTVSGTTVEIDAAFVVTSSVQFEGLTPDGNEITLTSADPTADRTITLPDLSGHIPLLASAATAASALVTPAEFSLLDGDRSRGSDALADGDGFLHNDDGSMKQTNVLKIAEYAFAKVSGDATISSAGALTLGSGVVEHGMLADDIISGQVELAHADLADADDMMISDATDGVVKRVGVDSLRDHFFGVVSGDAVIADGGALTIQPNAVEGSMLNDNVISGQAELSVSSASDIAGSDEFMISDAGTIKRVAMSGLKKFIGSGTAAVQAIADANGDLAPGLNVASAAATAPRTWTLPVTSGGAILEGESFVIKAYGNSDTHNLTIALQSGQRIDGATSNLLLESPDAAITLFYVGSNSFIIV